MLGSLSFHGDLTVLEGEDLERLGRLTEMYRTIRHLLCEDFYPLLPQPATDAQWEAVQFSKPDASEAIIFAFSGAEPLSDSPTIRAKALDAEATYTIRRLAGATKQTMVGTELMSDGLQVSLKAKQFVAWHLARQ